ncbi:MAG: membrane protein insertion efficiency factor YidD [Alphaproteobacteria bacterium CG_4_10_14_0_8_um_filter_53_9]|nr:MAG: membrane protein insertion efficiency factor YidD [Alphaproteobacteria bacterium CG_4_10_14_0_8_um_filter_53_9]
MALNFGQRLVLGLIRAYQLSFSYFLGGRCRFTPTCSHYAAAAVRTHGALRGSVLGLWRVLKCGPRGGSGFDPVPALWQDALPKWAKRLLKSKT